jgi:hypothetical protein
VENSPAPVANKLFEEKVIQYIDKGEIVVIKAVVQSRAKRFVENSRDATYSKDYVVRATQDDARERGENLTKRQAENSYLLCKRFCVEPRCWAMHSNETKEMRVSMSPKK